MTEETIIIIRHRLERAEETLREAQVLFESGFFFRSATCDYYACYYAVSALLLTKNLFSKTHKGQNVLFAQHFVAVGEVSLESMKVYGRMFAYRLDNDYQDFPSTTAEDAQILLAQAHHFVREITDLAVQAISRI